MTALALVVCALLVAVTANLGVPGEAALQTLRFHIAAGLVLLAIVLFMLGAWWRGLAFLVLAGLSIGQAANVLYLQQKQREVLAEQQPRPLMKLVSFNTLNPNTKGAEIADFLVNSGADVVYLMEALPIAGHLAQLATVFPYRAGCDDVATCDLTILSRTPLEGVRMESLSTIWSKRLITAKTTIGGQAINLAALHMVKPYFDGFAEEETYSLFKALQWMEGPVVVAGDFNAAAWSDNIDGLVRAANLVPGPYYPATWPIRLGPFGVPIDNVFTRAPLLVTRVEAMEDSMGSNHRGLVAEISLAQ